MMNWILTDGEDGLTALEVLRRRLPTAPSGYLRQLLRSGKIRRNGHPLAPEDVVETGDRLGLPSSARLRQLLETAPGPQPPILFESREILVVDKPAGLALHRGVGHEGDNLVKRVSEMMKNRKAPFRVAPAHRLDAETSGPVLFGKGRAATARLGKLFMAGEVKKAYLALVSGRPRAEGALDTPVPAGGKLKEARTLFRVLAGNRQLSLLELLPLSGRTHQIRRHLTAAGHPLAGDRRYGGPNIPELARLFLHCSRIELTDPFREELLAIESPLPPELVRALERNGLSFPPDA